MVSTSLGAAVPPFLLVLLAVVAVGSPGARITPSAGQQQQGTLLFLGAPAVTAPAAASPLDYSVPVAAAATPIGSTPAPRGSASAPRGNTPTLRGSTSAPKAPAPRPRGNTPATRGNTPATKSNTPAPKSNTPAARGNTAAVRRNVTSAPGPRQNAPLAPRAVRAPLPQLPPPRREKIIFAEEFNNLDPALWSHLVTAWRGGNQEFQYYRNDRRNSYVRGGVLYLRPTLTAREYGDAFLYTGKMYYPDCNFEPCVSASGGDIVLPIQSARIHTSGAFSFRYGRLEVRAKLPRGDWIWPAIWLKPATNAYGPWPASGEVDLVESRGNANLKQISTGEPLGVQKVGATLHFGPNSSYNIWRLTHWEKILERGDFADDFHVFGMEWSPVGFRFTVDNEEIGRMAPPRGGFWDLGGFESDPGGPNIWANGTQLAPFDKKFYIILNVAVGGTFFPGGMVNSPFPRPWNWTSGHPLREFWEHRAWWLPTWKGEHAAMQVDYVRVYQTVT